MVSFLVGIPGRISRKIFKELFVKILVTHKTWRNSWDFFDGFALEQSSRRILGGTLEIVPGS